MKTRRTPIVAAIGLLIVGLVAAGPSPAGAAGKKLSIAYMTYPIHEQQVKWMKRWGQENGVDVQATPLSYTVYFEKLTASLVAGSQEYDVIFHNDDWGQAWGAFLESVDDVKTIYEMDKAFLIDPGMLWPGPDGKKRATAVPMTETLGIFFYRKDLIAPDEYPKTWADLVRVSQRLQREKKVEWGFVGGMKYPNTYNTILWSLWANGCDIFAPPNERDWDALAKNGWKTMLTEKCFREAIEFWWDAMNTTKISPPGLVGYTSAEADGIFMAGRAFMTENDTTLWGKYTDPKASKIAGQVGMGRFLLGPSLGKAGVAWRAAWFWAIPKAIAPEQKKLAKELLTYLGRDEAQLDVWKAVGGIPPVRRVQDVLAREDALFQQVKAAVLDVPHAVIPVYYFKQWPRINATLSDIVSKALTGRREDIPAVLDEGARKLTGIMTQP
jgi:maltose-binding protein MalE